MIFFYAIRPYRVCFFTCLVWRLKYGLSLCLFLSPVINKNNLKLFRNHKSLVIFAAYKWLHKQLYDINIACLLMHIQIPELAI